MDRSHLALCLSLLLLPGTGIADVVVSEIVVDNDVLGFKAADGSAFDWIELHNNGASSVDLAGQYLTDDATTLDKWRFDRSFVIPAGGFRTVFASDRDGLFNGEEHTNFKLNSGSGEYLALIDSDGTTVLSEFSPQFPALLAEYVSYGRVSGGATLDRLAEATPNAANSGVAPVVKILSFKGSNAIIAGGADLILTWQTENADMVSLTRALNSSPNFGEPVNLGANDSLVRNPNTNTTYRLRATNAFGFHDAFVEVAVGPQILNLEAMPLTIASGGSTVVKWSSVGSDVTLELNGVAVELANGRQLLPMSGAPEEDTVIPVTMTATNANGTVSSTVNITVLARNADLPPIPPLVISEFYWSYQGAYIVEPYRFFEFHNRGANALDLDGIQLVGSKIFQFSNAEPRILAPDGYALVISDPAGFAEKWPGDRPVIGEFANPSPDDGFFWNLEQTLLDPYGRIIEQFTADQPLPEADIFNPAQRIDEDSPPVFPDNWKIIGQGYFEIGGGTPGEADFEILNFSFNPPHASPGDTVMLEWEISRDAQLTISGGIGAVTGPSGSIPFTVPLDATDLQLTLTANSSFATLTHTAQLILPPTIHSFWSSDTSISRGDEISLHWNVRSGSFVSFQLGPDITISNSPVTFTPLISGFEVGSLWKHLPNGNGQGPEWRDPDFDDRSWGYGLGIFGYGNDIETTELIPGDWVTAYFRRHFYADELDQMESLEVDLLVDDGAEVYLNGTEVLRDLLPEGEIDFNTRSSAASGNDGRIYRTFAIDPSALVEGDNVIAVGAHNDIPEAEDFEFDLGLRAVKAVPADGRKNYIFTASNSAGTASATVTILFEEKTSLATWSATNGLAGDPAVTDTDDDGLMDLVEFAIGSDPLSHTPTPITMEIDADGKLLVRFPRHLSREGIMLRAETSTTLKTWEPLTRDFVFEGSVAPPGSSVAESIHRSYGPTTTRRFLRLTASVIE